MKLILINKSAKILQYKNCKILNLCIYGSLERYFDINYQDYFDLIKPESTSGFKEKYLNKIDHIATKFYDNANKAKAKIEVLSYRSFSKLTVSDKLVDKFWVVEQIEKFKDENIFVFVDDIQIYNIYSSRKSKIWFQNSLPFKQFFYFFLFLFRKIKSNNRQIFKVDDDFNLFIGHKYEKTRNRNHIYDEYFFSKYWNNFSDSLLLLNAGDWHLGVSKSDRILLKESFLTFYDLFNLLFIAIKHFYFPLQVKENDIEDKLINFNLKIDVRSAAFIDSFINFYIYNNLSVNIKNHKGRIIIPHEGRSYEKIICVLFKNIENIEVVGYAHFPVSDKILNYYYKNFEDRIYKNFTFFTLSRSNYEYFNNIYNWPKSNFKIGSHLKSKSLETPGIKNQNYDILLLLGNELIPNLKLLKFLKLGIGTNNFKVLVRLHPSTMGIKIIMALFTKFGFVKSTNKNLQDDAMSSKIIAYGDTGASIDCLNFNLPLCYLMDDSCLISDRVQDDIFGHFRFFSVEDLQLQLSSLLVNDLSISYESILGKYISDIKPDTFIFE